MCVGPDGCTVRGRRFGWVRFGLLDVGRARDDHNLAQAKQPGQRHLSGLDGAGLLMAIVEHVGIGALTSDRDLPVGALPGRLL